MFLYLYTNICKMNERIKLIIDKEQITSSKFADLIGVQRSNISHILSGRNNPSLDFIQRVLTVFDKINSDWLIFGRGEMYKSEKPSLFTNLNKSENIENNNIIKDKILDSEQDIKPDKKSKQEKENKQEKESKQEKENKQEKESKQEKIIKQEAYQEKEIEREIETKQRQHVAPVFENYEPNNSKKIEQIVIFYTDKTFTVYAPNKL